MSIHSPGALNVETAAVPDQYMFDDGKSQPGAASGLGTAAINPVKTLGQARQMFGRNALACIGDAKPRLAIAQFPRNVDRAAGRRISHRIGHKIAERAGDFVPVPDEPDLIGRDCDGVLAVGQLFSVAAQRLHQFRDIERCFCKSVTLVLQPREREQNFNQPLHAHSLSGHMRQRFFEQFRVAGSGS